MGEDDDDGDSEHEREDRGAFEEFLIQEGLLLDQRRFRDWMELFAEDGTYWVPAVPEQASPFDQASLFYDDRDLMRTRIEFDLWYARNCGIFLDLRILARTVLEVLRPSNAY